MTMIAIKPVAMNTFITLAFAVLSAAAGTLQTAETWRVDQGDVRVICPMTVGGSFHATTTTIRGLLTANADGSPAFDGTLAVDLRTLDTGIGLRNEHLREKYLEVGKGPGFESATLAEVRVNAFQPGLPESTRSFTGLLTLHGVTRAVSGSAGIRPTSNGVRVKANFPVALADYGIPTPRYLGVGVKDVVQVEVAFGASR
jgi:polyisoprenoid-binding protein YceI